MISATNSGVQTSESTKQAIEAFTGTKIPRGRRAQLLQDASTLDQLADFVRNLLGPELVQTIKAVGNSVDGQTAARFVAQTAPFVATTPAILIQVATLQNQVADAMRGYAVEMDYLERQALIMFIFMMVELAIAAAEAFFAPEDAIERVATTRTIIQVVLRSNITKMAARSLAIQMLFMPGSSLLAQVSQMADGIRDSVDWSEVGKQALYGLAVAAITTLAGPVLARGNKAFVSGLGKVGVKESWRDPLAGFVMRPAGEISMEVGGGVGAAYIVDHKYDPGNARGDAISGAAESGTGMAATHVGIGGRRGAKSLGFTPHLPHLKLPGGTAFSATGTPVLPLDDDPPPPYPGDDVTTTGPDSGDPTAGALAKQAPPPAALGDPDLPSPPLVAPSLALPLVPTPDFAGVGAALTGQWQQFQQELLDRYGDLLSGATRAAQVLATLPVGQVFDGWVQSRAGTPAVAEFLDQAGLPATALDPGFLAGVREQAVARMTEAAARTGATPEQILAGLPAEFDRQALRSAAHLAAARQVDQYFAGPAAPLAGSGAGPAPAAVRGPAAALRAEVQRQVRVQVDRGLDAILGTSALPTVPSRPGAAQVTAVVNVARQATTDLPTLAARSTVDGAGHTPPATAPEGAAPAGTAPAGTAPVGPVEFETRVAAAAGLARKQFEALAAYQGTGPAVPPALAASFEREWLGGYRQIFDPAATPTVPQPATTAGTVEIDTERWRRISQPFQISDGRMTRLPDSGERIAVRYAMTPAPDAWTFQVRLHLTGRPGVDLDAVKQATRDGVATYLNRPEHVLPDVGAPMRVEVQFVDDPAQAHATVRVGEPGSGTDQVNWAPDAPPATYAHEVLHFLGATDARAPGAHDPAGPTLMGRHDHSGADLPVTEGDLRQIVATLAPHYAGVVGSFGPAGRPDGAATAAAGPTSVAPFWDAGLDRPPEMDGQPPAPPEEMLNIPADGYCLLYAFIASDPAVVRTTLATSLPDGLPDDLDQFLADPALVRAVAGLLSHTGVPVNSPLRRVARLLQQHVMNYLETNAQSGQLPPDVTGQRLHFYDDRVQEARTLGHTQVIRRLEELGVTHGGGVPVRNLTPEQARDLLVRTHLTATGQLDSFEFAQLLHAVENWTATWNTPAGEFFGPLLANATGTRIRLVQVTPHGRQPVPGAHGPAGGTQVTLFHVAANPDKPREYNHFNAAIPGQPVAPLPPDGHHDHHHDHHHDEGGPDLGGLSLGGLGLDGHQQDSHGYDDQQDQQEPVAPRPPARPTGPSADAPLVTMAKGLPENVRLQRAVGATLLHGENATPRDISPRVPAPTGPGPAILLDSSVLDPDDLARALSGLRAEDTTMAVLHWPADQQVSSARALEVAGRALAPRHSSALLSVPRSALTDLPRPDPRIIPLDANGDVTFFSGRPERYLVLPEVDGAPARPAPYGLPELSPRVYDLGDGWVAWDGGGHLWIGPAAALDNVRDMLPDTGPWLPEPVVFLGWQHTPMPDGVRDRVGRMFAAMPAGSPSRLITSGIGRDRRTFDLTTARMPDGVTLTHVPGGLLAHAGTRPPAGASTLHWSDLANPTRPRLVLDGSVDDPVAVVDAVVAALGADGANLQVFVAPPGATPAGTADGTPAAPAGTPAGAARVAAALRARYGGMLELVLPTSVVGRQPADAGTLVPVDARGRQTLPTAAHAWVVPGATTPARAPHPLGLRPAKDGGYRVARGWTATEHNGVLLVAENGTSPDTLPAGALDVPATGVAVVIQSQGRGPIPRDVAATVSRVLSGVPERDRHVRVYGNAHSAGPATPDPTPTPAPPERPDPRVLPLANPKANLPGLDRVEQALRGEARRRNVEVPASAWETVRQELLNNYKRLATPDGHLVVLGTMEVRARLEPHGPQLVTNPAGAFDTTARGESLDDKEGRKTTGEGRFHANQLTEGEFQTGAHGQGDSTTARSTRLPLDVGADIPIGPTLHAGPKFTAVVNRADQRSGYLVDAEKGRVLDTRADSTLYSYEPGWRLESRVGDETAWHNVTVPDEPGQRLVLAIPDHLLGTAGAQVVADLPAGQRDKLERVPKRIFASNISGLTGLYDNIVTQLRADGYDMSVGSKIRQELRRKLWNLDVHFDEAVNNKPPRPAAEAADGSAPAGGEAEAPRPEGETRGYKFTLEDDGVPVATIRVYADRRTGAVRMGSTSDKAHIEGVRTGILGQGGEYTVMQSSGMTFGVGTDLPLHKLPWDLAEIYKKYVKLGLTGRGGVSWNSNDGGGATRASLNVVVSRYTGFTLGHQVPFRFAAEVSTLARPGLAPRRTPSVDGSAVLRMSEPDAFDHGFSVDEDAFAPDPADTAAPPEDAPATKAPPTEPATEAPKDASSTGAPPTGKKPAKQVPYDQWRRRLRNTGRHPEDTGGNVLPEHVRLGRGLGQGLPDIDEAAIARIRTGMGNLLRDNGFLPPDQDRPWMVDAPPPAAPVRPAPPADGAPADGAPADGAPATDDESSDGEASESTPLLPPGNPVREGYNEAVKRDRKQLVQNQDLFDKMVSNDGLESHFDPLSQDGMTFVLHSWRNSVMRTAEVTVRAVSRITDAVDAEGNSVHFVRLTDELHTVTLAMSLGIAGQGASGNQGFSLEGGLRLPMPEQVQALDSVGLFGGSISRSIGAAERLTRIVNRPELTEYSGRVALHDLPYDLVYTVKFSDRATPVTSTPVPATVRSAVLRLNTDPSVFSETAAANTEPSVLDQAVVYFLDTHGVRAAAEGQLPAKLTRTGAPMVGPVYSLSSHISLQANFKEALASQYTTDTLVEPGFWYNTNAALSIGVPRIGGARFVGATPDQYVAGLIDLYLTETANTASRSFAHSYNLPDFKLAHNFGPIKTSYENSTSVKVSESESAETKRTGGLEILDLSFKRAYAFEAPVDFGVRSGTHTQIGFVYDGVDVPAASNVSGRTMLFLLPEAQALAEYAAGRLPISQPQLLEAMTRWSRGELVLSGNTVAGLLTRWQRALARSAARGAPDLSAYLVRHRVRAFAQELAARHADPQQRSAVADPARKTAFRDAFHIQLDPAVDPFSTLSIPPYLTRTGARTLGHHGVDKLTLYSGPTPKGGGPRPTTTLLDAVHTHVNAVAPGLLGPSHGRWADARSTWRVLMFSPNLRAVGNLPGGIDTLQAVLAGQRVNATFSDMLNRYNGVRFFLINRDGPVLSDVVGLTVWASLDGRPRYVDWVPEYGIENYGHNYGGYGLTLARALGWSLTPAKFGFSSDGSPISGDFSFGFAPLGGYSLKGGYQLTREQTAYDWSGHYLAVQDVTVNIGAQRLKMHNRYANNFGQALWKLANNAAADLLPAGLTDFTALLRVQDESSRAYPGKLEFKVPRGLAEAQPVPRAPGVDLRPLPSFPGDVYVSGVLADDLYPAAGKLMSRLLSSDADDPSYRGNLALSGLLSRLNVDNHLPDTLGPDGYLLGSHLFVSGASNNRAALRLYGSLHSMEVVSKIVNATGTGRYAKFHLVSAASQNRSRWRTNFAFELAFGKPLGDTNVGAQEHTTAKITFTTGANRNAPMNQSATYEDTKRSETHLKMQGVVYLVKLRGRFHLGGVQHRHHMFSTDNGLDTFGPEKFRGARSSGTVTGDVYVEMFADEVEDLRLALDSPHDWAAANPSRWPAPSARARTFDLTDLLERTTPRAMAANPVAGRTIQAGDFDPGQAAPHAALLIRHRLGNHYEQVAPIRLTVNAVEQARRRYELTLNWAIDRLTRAAEPGSPPAALLTRLAGWQVEVAPVAAGGPMPDGLAQAFGPRTEQIIEQVRALQPPGSPPLTPPDEVVMLGHDPIDVARGVAFELGTHLDLTVTPVTGAARRYRIDPQGWVVQLRPTATGGHVVPTAASVVATLPADLRNRATAAGVDPADAYAHLLTTTSVQMDAADGLRDEVEERIRQARDSADDRTRRWLAEGLPTLPGTPLPDGPVRDTPDGRAGRARRLLSAALGPGWTTSGPLRQVPAAPRPGTRLWIARPQGAFAAQVQVDGRYLVLDPYHGDGTPRTVDLAEFQRLAAAPQAVTMVEPGVLESWLLHDGAWPQSRQFAQNNLAALRADPTAARLADAQQQARRPADQPAPQPGAAPPPPGPGDPVLNRHATLLDAIRGGQVAAPFDYLAAGTPQARTAALTGALAAVTPGDPTAPSGLRALADLVAADPRIPPAPAGGPPVVTDVAMLRAVADILDPSVSPLTRLRAMEVALHNTDRLGWQAALGTLAGRFPPDSPVAADLTALATMLRADVFIDFGHLNPMLDGLANGSAAALAGAVDASGASAADLARVWRTVNDPGQLAPALPGAAGPSGAWAGGSAAVPSRPAPAVVSHPAPPGPDTLDQWMAAGANWDASRAYLDAHLPQLLSDTTHNDLQIRRARQPEDTPALATADGLLTLARYGRVADGYRYLRGLPPTVPAPGAPTGRQELLADLLSQPDLADAAAVGALANLAGTLSGPTDLVDTAILRLTADTLAGLTVDGAGVTDLVRRARQELTGPQRRVWADALLGLSDHTIPARRAALRDLANRLHIPAPEAPAAPATQARDRQRVLERLHETSREFERARADLATARTAEQRALDARAAAQRALDTAGNVLRAAELDRDSAQTTIDRLDVTIPALDRVAGALEARLPAARQAVADAPDPGQAATAQRALDDLEHEAAEARREHAEAVRQRAAAVGTRDALDARLPDLRRSLLDAGEEFHARDVAVGAHTTAVRGLANTTATRQAARDAAAAAVGAQALVVPPASRSADLLDLEAELTELAAAGHGPAAAVPELADLVRRRFGDALPGRVVLRTDPALQAAASGAAPADARPVLDLDRVRLARDLAAALGVPVELRVGGTPAPRPYLAYPGGAVIRLDATGAPETVADAVERLPQQIRDALRPHQGRADVQNRMAVLHEAEIEAMLDLSAGVSELLDNANRFQGYLAYRWVTHASPPADPTQPDPQARLGVDVPTDLLGVPPVSPPVAPTDPTRSDLLAAAWLTYDPARRAAMMVGLLTGTAGLGYTVAPATRTRPATLPPNTRLLVVAGATIAAGLVGATGQVNWYEPGRNAVSTGSLVRLGQWAAARAGGGDDIWYIVLTPTSPPTAPAPPTGTAPVPPTGTAPPSGSG